MSRQNPEDSSPHKVREPIAIVGIGCRWPGGANSPEAFWELLCAGTDAIRPMPADRFPADLYDDTTLSAPGQIATRQGGFLDRIDSFDAQFFGVSPREASAMDPQQRLLLETAWEALADAGIPAERVAGSQAGVYIGMWTNEYEQTMFTASNDIDLYMTTGGGRYAAAGRLSYIFDLQGPSLTIDTACSSSLVAVHLACQSLWSKEIDLALVGAVNLILQPSISIGYSRSRMLSPDGRCKFGDAGANGYVRSEGCAVVALKPLARALADNDQIYALIRGTAVNNDGHSSGLLVAPSGQGQLTLLQEAYRQAGIMPGEVDYVEAHGTGTPVGDPVELRALGAVLAEGRAPGRPCIVGSVKTNIGHTEAASGMAGLIKAALCLKHGIIPANLHHATPNPAIPWAELPLVVQRSLGPWPVQNGPRFAGVNSFGVTGTNAHVVLEAAPEPALRSAAPAQAAPLLFPISSQTPEALLLLAQSYRTLLADEETCLADLSYSMSARQTHHRHRLAIIAHGHAEAIEAFDAWISGATHPRLVTGQAAEATPKIAFVFPGQGAQWLGMARELFADEPVFREALSRCDTEIHAEAGWSPIVELHNAEDQSRLHEIQIIQPLLFAVQISLAALWQSWGAQPAAVVGHSMGEVAAAYVAGALSLTDAVRVICRRSRLLWRVRGQGAMAVVDLSLEEAQSAIAGYEDRLAVAVSNSARSTVLSGDTQAIDAVAARLQAKGVFCRLVKVDVASHSPQMDPLLDELRAALSELRPQTASLPIYSTVDTAIVDGGELNAAYWARNLREPVRFATEIQQLIADGIMTFVEISPHPLLLPAIDQGLLQAGQTGQVVPSLRRGEPERATMLRSLAALYSRGCMPGWAALAPEGARLVRLPAYPWQRERFWHEAAPKRRPANTGGHPLLGPSFRPAAEPGSIVWQPTIDLKQRQFLGDHRVQGVTFFPATGFVELALAAAAELGGDGVATLEDLAISEALIVSDAQPRELQVALEPISRQLLRLRVFSAENPATADVVWQLNAEGRVRIAGANPQAAYERPATIQGRCIEEASSFHQQSMKARSLQYGPAFRTVADLWRGRDEVLGRLVPHAGTRSPETLRITMLDGALQLAIAALPPSTAGKTFLPVRLGSVWMPHLPADAMVWGHAVLMGHEGHTYSYDVRLLDDDGHILAEVRGLELRQVQREVSADIDDLLYAVQWQPTERPRQAPALSPGSWLVFAPPTDGQRLVANLAARGEHCVLVTHGASYHRASNNNYILDPDDAKGYAALIQSACGPNHPPLRGIVYGWEFPGAADCVRGNEQRCTGLLTLVQALAAVEWQPWPRLWLLTRAAQPAGDQAVHAGGALLWGLGRVIINEYPRLRCTLVDLSAVSDELEYQSLGSELWAGAGGLADDQVALRGNSRYLARMVPATAPVAAATPHAVAPANTPYQLIATAPGMLNSLRLREMPRRAPGPGEIEVQVSAAGLNFLDTMKALATYPGVAPGASVALGAECAGIVVQIGPHVQHWKIGDRVVVITPSYEQTSCLSAFVTVPTDFAAPMPDGLTDAQAAGLPVAFLTAYYALHILGRLVPGERVLIHAAAGGVGLAAVQLCQRAGAQIFATAGSEEKRDYLRSLGISHIFDSRSLAFADQVLAATGGRGVDLVLNSLAGEAIPRSLDILAPRGRFLELGKRDIYANSRIGLEPFKKNLAFHAIDLAGLTAEDPAYVSSLYQEVLNLFGRGELRPLPVEHFAIGDAIEAFHHMAQARHIGKVVLSLQDQPVAVEAAPKSLIQPDASYLITGGLGALGLEVASWLVGQGACQLALVGRSAPSATASAAIDALEAAGAKVLILQADVAQPSQLQAALEQVRTDLPPLRGIIHAAGVLYDATLEQLTHEAFRAALAPKVDGALNLHRLTATDPLDLFVLFSSAVALLGLAGQANYAAANAFLDALAYERRSAGRPALSINWGPWAEIGLAALQANRGSRLAVQGLGSLLPHEGLAALEVLLRQELTQAAVLRFDAQAWVANSLDGAVPSILTDLLEVNPQERPSMQSLREALLAIEPGRRRQSLLEDAICAQIAQVLRIAPERIERQRPLKVMGLDSLMALELRNRLEAVTGLTLSATLAWNYPTIAILAGHLADRMGVPLSEPAQVAEPVAVVEISNALDDLDLLSDDTVEALLDDELAAIERLLKAE